ncbi:MAG: arginyltransferase [Planctomycetota bacterium]|nr:MAG: arginyltransferase [Planctomycetota bacterium]
MPDLVQPIDRCPYHSDGRPFHAELITREQLPQEAGINWPDILLHCGWRRWGEIFYRPHCPGCQDCIPVRVDCPRFRPRRDQRRCRHRNADLRLSQHRRSSDPEHRDLFLRYQQGIHNDHSGDSDLLNDRSPLPSFEIQARDQSGRLLAVSICDCLSDGISSVYCYYDPEQRQRSLGTFMILAEILEAQRLHLRWLYLGFSVQGCSKMRYKDRFRPQQLWRNGSWEDREPTP